MKKFLFLAAAMLLSVPAMAKLCMIESRNTDLFKLIYPVGSLYMSVNGTEPATLFGFGTWEKFAPGRVLVGAGTSDRAFASGETGGASTHQLSIAEMPKHQHSGQSFLMNVGSGTTLSGASGTTPVDYHGKIPEQGGNQPHNNLQPYIVVNIWVRRN